MMDRRLKRFWYRAGPLAACGALLAGGANAAGCGSDSTTSSTTTGSGGESPTTTSTTSTSNGGAGGGGGSVTTTTGTGGPMNVAIALSVDIHRPFDSVPSATGTQAYFTANGVNGLGVYKASIDGAAPSATPLYPTAPDDPTNPFSAPFGIELSTDGEQIFIADAAAGSTDLGAIYAMAIGGSAPKVVMGTDGTTPHSLAVVDVGGKDTIYFTGTEAVAGGQRGVFSVPAGGGAVTKVFAGGVLKDPSGIAVAKDGTIYLTDTTSSANGAGQILYLKAGGEPTVLIDNVRLGYPSGLALSLDEKSLYVSGFDAASLTDRVIVVDIGEKSSVSSFATELGTFTEAAGLHRARTSSVFTFVDSTAGASGGKVFVLK
jgi:sugar lactone lactonase YvrE